MGGEVLFWKSRGNFGCDFKVGVEVMVGATLKMGFHT